MAGMVCEDSLVMGGGMSIDAVYGAIGNFYPQIPGRENLKISFLLVILWVN